MKNYAIFHGYGGHYKYGRSNCDYCDNGATWSAEYYVDKQYSSISFDMAPFVTFGASSSSSVKVYVDDVLVYTSTAITQKTERFNSGKIDISNAEYIKIVVDAGRDGCVVLSDVILENKQS